MIIGTEGDCGDAIYLMGVMNSIPDGPHTLILQDSRVTKGLRNLVASITPLASAQPYIKECRVEVPGEHIDWKSGMFRGAGYHSTVNTLFDSHVGHFRSVTGINHEVDLSKRWITCEPSPYSKGRVVINRTGRYNNPYFSWASVVEMYGDSLLFVGAHVEHDQFTSVYGPVEHKPTNNLLEVAELIAGSELFIGNQSAPYAICEGLKHESILEVCLFTSDCVFKRDNAQHCYNGEMTLRSISGLDDKKIPSFLRSMDRISTMISPPGFWYYPGTGKTPDFDHCCKMVSQLDEFRGADAGRIRDAILRFTVERCPEFQVDIHEFSYARTSLKNAGYDINV